MACAPIMKELPIVKGLSQRTAADKAEAQRNDTRSHERLRALQRLSGNRECADCTSKLTGWAALPHGVFLCIACAQLHRHIGRHISQVKAINTGTYLWYPDEIDAMETVGNVRANSFYCAAAIAPPKPLETASAAEKESYVRDKYERRLWVARQVVSAPVTTRTTPAASPSQTARVAAAAVATATATLRTATAPSRRAAMIATKPVATPSVAKPSVTDSTPDLIDFSDPVTHCGSTVRQPVPMSCAAASGPATPSALFFQGFGL